MGIKGKKWIRGGEKEEGGLSSNLYGKLHKGKDCRKNISIHVGEEKEPIEKEGKVCPRRTKQSQGGAERQCRPSRGGEVCKDEELNPPSSVPQ